MTADLDRVELDFAAAREKLAGDDAARRETEANDIEAGVYAQEQDRWKRQALALLGAEPPEGDLQKALDGEDLLYGHTPVEGPIAEACSILWPEALSDEPYPATFGGFIEIATAADAERAYIDVGKRDSDEALEGYRRWTEEHAAAGHAGAQAWLERNGRSGDVSAISAVGRFQIAGLATREEIVAVKAARSPDLTTPAHDTLSDLLPADIKAEVSVERSTGRDDPGRDL